MDFKIKPKNTIIFEKGWRKGFPAEDGYYLLDYGDNQFYVAFICGGELFDKTREYEMSNKFKYYLKIPDLME